MHPRITDLFSEAVAHLKEADPALARIIDLVGPPTLTLRGDGFTSLVYSIISQQISVRAAAAIRDRLVGLFPSEPGITPEGLIQLGPERLRQVGLSQAKTRYLLDLASRVAAGEVEIERFPELSDEEIIAELIKVKGIGRWTAEMYLIFCLGRPDVLPVDDLGLRAGIKRLRGLDRLPTTEESRQYGAPWQPYRSLATWYLWRSAAVVPAVVPAAAETPEEGMKPPT